MTLPQPADLNHHPRSDQIRPTLTKPDQFETETLISTHTMCMQVPGSHRAAGQGGLPAAGLDQRRLRDQQGPGAAGAALDVALVTCLVNLCWGLAKRWL